MSSKKRITELEKAAGLINITPFAVWVKERNPSWKGTDYQAYCLWLEDQLNRHDEHQQQTDDAETKEHT